jgi:lipoprotein-anchoring transpeptidase ErfK/SrfK
LVKEGVLLDTCFVSTGREGYNTPAGRYVITDKHRTWTSTSYHGSMPFFMRLNCRVIFLHSGYVTGRSASHGCIRLPYEKAQKFFGICRVGDEVQIVH